MKALVLLLASLLFLDGSPAHAQEEENQGIKVYGKRGVIYKSNLDGSGEQRLTEGWGPALSPDQRQVAFPRDGNLYLLDLETMEEKILVEYDPDITTWSIDIPFWHPRGSTIFFNWVSVFLSDIYAVEKDGTNLRLVVAGGGLYDFLSWPGPFSPDGSKLLYTDCHDACETLRVVDLGTGTRTRLSERTSYGAWSPNGSYIAFGDAWGPGLYYADAAGTQVRQILDNVQVRALSWSSDSQRIAFTQVSDGDGATGASGGIYEVELDGTGKQARDAHFDRWEHALPSTVVEERTWGQVKQATRHLSTSPRR